MTNALMASDTEPDLCGQEPIQFPGAVQSHGCLMVMSRAGQILAVSENVEPLLGCTIDSLLGKPLWRVLSHRSTWLSNLHHLISRTDWAPEYWLPSVELGGSVWDVRLALGHWGPAANDDCLLLEWLPGSGQTYEDDRRLFESVSRALRDLHDAASLPGYLASVTRALQEFTGYDRVMVYRFEPDWSGVVLAEAAGEGMTEQYLDHRFPASDIPPQARALYLEQPVRVIADVDSPPAGLAVAPGAPGAATGIDLSQSGIRAVSPVHLQYLRHMGVRATVVLSLIHQGVLWGMLVCHHRLPRRPPRHMTHLLCVASEIILGNVTSHVANLLALEQAEQSLHIQQALATLERSLEHMGQRFHLHHAHDDLLKTFDADGLCICMDGDLLCGQPVPETIATRLRAHWTSTSDVDFASDQLSAVWPDSLPADWPYVGLLAVQLGESDASWIVLWRREYLTHVKWAGDPSHKTYGPRADPLTPRASFDSWVQTVRGRSTPWVDMHRKAALELARIILLRRQGWEVRRFQHTLRQFMEQQETAFQQDRARLALLVHDQLGQLMAAARLKISHLADTPSDLRQTGAMVRSAMDDLEEAMEVARNISHHLYPLALQHGLMAALESLVEDVRHRSGLAVTLSGTDIPPTVPSQVSEVFFGIAREALNNVVRHAQAHTAQVQLSYTRLGLRMQIQDDGVGFEAINPNGERHFGLFGMRERATWIRADLMFSNRAEGGACVELTWHPAQIEGDAA